MDVEMNGPFLPTPPPVEPPKPPVFVAAPVVLAVVPLASGAPFRHPVCSGCDKAIADDQGANVYAYAGVSYHFGCEPATAPPMPEADDA
jgi:hypothetical protein